MNRAPLSQAEHNLVSRARYLVTSAESLRLQIERVEKQAEEALRLLRQSVSEREAVQRILMEKTKCFPWLADAIAQWYALCDEKVASYLERKLRPAHRAASLVKQALAEKREWRKKFVLARNRVKYYEALFPWLAEYVADDLDDIVTQASVESTVESAEDPVRRFVQEAEYRGKSSAERNQLALDRYRSRAKRSWEVGRDYERFCGYELEEQGYCVSYHGAAEGLADLGRDLIARRRGEVLIVQCKYWREERRVREKHVFQLYGTSVEYWIKNRGERATELPILFPQLADADRIIPMLITSARLSDEARKFAGALGIQVRERHEYRSEYPCIKCNIAKADGAKIYHLPFDQQYDTTIIERDRGERYVASCAEAEKLGYRRAWRWKGRGEPGD